MSERGVRVAAAQYWPEDLSSWDAVADKLTHWVREAAGEGAGLLVFPEYFSMEITASFGPEVARSLPLSLARLQERLPDFIALFRDLAREHTVFICAGSFPERLPDGRHCNRSYFFTPAGACGYQEKLQMTRFETEQWHVSPGRDLKVFDTDFGRVAINICYDSEFPLLARQQVEQGADILLVPSCTDTLAGYHRVRIGCQARALENQCFVVQSPTVGECPWSESVDRNTGAAAVYTPVDYGFPADGVLVCGEMNSPQWVYADLDLGEIARIRKEGQVFNYRDWPAQYDHVQSPTIPEHPGAKRA
ncbi:MAG: carbon-nitrogen hydrolase family protein [Gammaproteobacteria bacterium]|nr:carbon-nitrogen hydrolase family protein [Gammaproteobacteria bacterium]